VACDIIQIPPTNNKPSPKDEKPKPSKRGIDKTSNKVCRAHIIPKGLAKLCTRADAHCLTADCSAMMAFDASRSFAEELTQALVLRMPSSCLVV
jgi:hypothetical protein